MSKIFGNDATVLEVAKLDASTPAYAKLEWLEYDEEELLEEEEEQEEENEEEEEDRGDEVDEDEDEEDDEEEVEDKDEEDEDEEEVEDKDEEEVEDEEEDTKKSQSIPRQRFDEVYGKFKTERAKTREQAQKIAELEKKLGTDKEAGPSTDELTTEIKSTRKEMLKAIDDGKTEEAERLMDKLDELNDKRIDQRLSEGFKSTSKASTQEVEYNILVEKIEDSFPVFDEVSEHYDSDLIGEVLDIQQEFERAGNAPALALEKAMRYYKDEVEESMKAAGLLDPDDDDDTVSKTLKSRKIESKKRNKKAKGSQPKKSGGSDNKGDITINDLINMSEKEFDGLSEAKLRELRGDIA